MVGHASRLKARVQFDLTVQSTEAFVPFVVVVPDTFNGQFVRFVHPFNGKVRLLKSLKKRGPTTKPIQHLPMPLALSQQLPESL